MRSLGKAAARGIAEALHLSVKTVESHRHRINGKLKLEDGAELVRFALQLVKGSGPANSDGSYSLKVIWGFTLPLRCMFGAI